MHNNYRYLTFLAVSFLLLEPGHAFTRKASIDFEKASNADGNYQAPISVNGNSDSNPWMLSLARSASEGAGRLSTPGAYCYRAVKQIIADAFGKDLQCVRSILTGGSAKNAGPDLQRAGFVNDMSKCKSAGAIRVYTGKGVKGYRKTAGDIHGHIEVVGDEGMYHSFYSSSLSIDESMSRGRRVLTGCYVPDAKSMVGKAFINCPDSKVSYKTKKSKTKAGGGIE